MKDIKAFSNFVTFPLHMSAFTNEKRDVKKSVSALPKDWINLPASKPMNTLVWKKEEGQVKPNGIGVITTNISIIDIDQPSKCSILDKLKADCGFWVQTKNGFHFYFKKENMLPRQCCRKIADINTNLLYFCPAYFHKDTGVEYNYTLMKKDGLVDMPQYALDWCNMLISMGDEKDDKFVKKIKKTGTTEKIIIAPDIEIEKFDLKTMDNIIEILYNSQILHKYNGWRDAAYMARHLNNSEESFKIFDKYSKKVADEKCIIKGLPKTCEKYKNKTRKMFYGDGSYNENFDENGVLIKCSKLNPEKFKTTLQYLYTSKWDSHLLKIDQKYIYPDDGSSDHIFDDWVTNYKALGIQSAYGTGKTYAFKKLIDKYKFKRVLFITYRQSLAHSLSLELAEKFGFQNYLDEDCDVLKAQRLIIQLDSIKRLHTGFNFITQEDHIQKYDLIILDEIEGMLNHLSFEKIEQYSLHNVLVRLINKAPKILALDGDMNDRSFDFISDLCYGGNPREPPTSSGIGYKFYSNEYKPNKKNFLFSHNLVRFNRAIEADLKAGKKICIVSMTKSDTERFYIEYKDKYKVCLHNSIERNKEILKRVNEEWAKCDLLIYSPSVESGVDFNIENYFYKCYAILNAQSTTYRAFNQMLNRVRYYESNEVLCLMPHTMSYKVNEILYRFDEMMMTKYTGLERSNLIDILVHNDTERINSTNYFICAFINSLNKKGHSHKYLYDKPIDMQLNKISGKEHIIECISRAKIISMEEYDDLVKLQQQNKELTREEYFQVQKIFYARVFKEDPKNINESWLGLRYNKTDMPKNWTKLNLPVENRYEYKDTEYLKKFGWERIDRVKKLLGLLGVKVENNEIIVEKEIDFDQTSEEIIKFINDKKFKTLFNNDRQLKNCNMLKVLNDTLNDYGLVVFKEKINGKRDEMGKQQISYKHVIREEIGIIHYLGKGQAPKEDIKPIPEVIKEEKCKICGDTTPKLINKTFCNKCWAARTIKVWQEGI